ncbi:unnamed protein product [Effrenium voratum]|uniref:Uncharacterized protein n=1 Tax=Effrenium voratum TaxID=2562239 RepID=A0AA36NK20_9DINO|nr:unnamed protein product [Effrenium voratum]
MLGSADLAHLAACALLQLALVVRFFQKAWPWRWRIAKAICELPGFARGVVSQLSQKPSESDRILRKQVSQLQLEFAQSYASVGASTLCVSLSNLQRNVFTGNPRPRFFTALATWNGLFYNFCLVATWLPGILTVRTLNLCCLLSHVFVAVWLSPGGCVAPSAFAVRLFCLGAIQVPCLLFAQSWLMACVVYLGVVVMVVLRSLLGDAEDSAGTIFENPGTLVGAEIIMAACVGILVHFLYNSFEQRVAARLRENHVSSQLDAASGLLQLTCEAVMELDADLRLTEHCPKLAAMLLRGGFSTQGLRFSEFVARDEAARAEEILQYSGSHGSSSVAQAFHTHLVDSCASKFRTEVFQVKYQLPSGQTRHLIGLREFTDLQSLAGNKAADAIHDTDREQLELYEGLSCLRGHSDALDLSEDMDSSGCRIVEQAVALQGKNIFLDLDVQAMQVCAASAPLTSLIGRSLSEVFVYNYTLELCMRLWRQAKQCQDLPDNMVSFERMPLFCVPRTIEISGIMQLSRTSLGDLHVILNFRPSALVQL